MVSYCLLRLISARTSCKKAVNKMNFLKISSVVAITALIAPGAMAAEIMIDDFEAAQRVQDLASGPFPQSSTINDGSILGLSRALSVVTSPQNATQPVAGSVLESTGAGGLPVSDALVFSNSGNQVGVATVVYDGDGGGLGDLTDGGFLDKFFFEVLSADLSGTIFTTTVDDGTNSGTFVENIGATFDPFLRFSEAVFAGVDFSNVASLTFTFDSNGIQSFDGTLGSISVVPLPLSSLLILGGLGGLAGANAVSKRRRKA